MKRAAISVRPNDCICMGDPFVMSAEYVLVIICTSGSIFVLFSRMITICSSELRLPKMYIKLSNTETADDASESIQSSAARLCDGCRRRSRSSGFASVEKLFGETAKGLIGRQRCVLFTFWKSSTNCDFIFILILETWLLQTLRLRLPRASSCSKDSRRLWGACLSDLRRAPGTCQVICVVEREKSAFIVIDFQLFSFFRWLSEFSQFRFVETLTLWNEHNVDRSVWKRM